MLFVFIMLITPIAFPLLFIIRFYYANPCKHSLIGYFVLPECYSGSPSHQWLLLQVILNHIAEAVVIFGNFWIGFTSLHGCVFLMIWIPIIGAILS